MEGGPEIKKIQERVANVSIGPSTLRNQGAKGVPKAARKFLMGLDLREISSITEESEFRKWLDDTTTKLKEKLPDGARNFGTARKALNVFLEEAFYNRFLSQEYNLHRLEGFLELPWDSLADEYLREEGKKEGLSIEKLPNLNTIKGQEKDDNEKFQQFAKNLAIKKATSRIYLDLYAWADR